MKKKRNIKHYFIIFMGIAVCTYYGCSDENDSGLDLDQIAYDDADVVNGGRMYDKFWADETNYNSPSDPSVVQADIENFGNFYRCKQCHGWDQKGSLGAYIDRGPKTGRPDVSTVQLVGKSNTPIRTLFDQIKHTGGAAVEASRTADGTNSSLGGNDMPDYGEILTDAQIWDLVKFLREGAFDTDQLYTINTTGTYPGGSRDFTNIGDDGDATIGAAFYAQNCASCHGDNGRDNSQGNPKPINVNIGRSMGEFAREKPYELQHKARFGNLGSNPQMLGIPNATFDDIKNMLKALGDPANYPDLQ